MTELTSKQRNVSLFSTETPSTSKSRSKTTLKLNVSLKNCMQDTLYNTIVFIAYCPSFSNYRPIERVFSVDYLDFQSLDIGESDEDRSSRLFQREEQKKRESRISRVVPPGEEKVEEYFVEQVSQGRRVGKVELWSGLMENGGGEWMTKLCWVRSCLV